MITYESLRTFRDNERIGNSFVKLPDDFFQQAEAYLTQKETLQKDAWETAAARRMLTDLLERREKKVLDHAFLVSRTGNYPENMMPHEHDLLEKVCTLLKTFHGAEVAPDAEQPVSEKGVEFIEDLPAFVGPDMKTYGPFKRGDHAELPSEVKGILLRRGSAR